MLCPGHPQASLDGDGAAPAESPTEIPSLADMGIAIHAASAGWLSAASAALLDSNTPYPEGGGMGGDGVGGQQDGQYCPADDEFADEVGGSTYGAGAPAYPYPGGTGRAAHRLGPPPRPGNPLAASPGPESPSQLDKDLLFDPWSTSAPAAAARGAAPRGGGGSGGAFQQPARAAEEEDLETMVGGGLWQSAGVGVADGYYSDPQADTRRNPGQAAKATHSRCPPLSPAAPVIPRPAAAATAAAAATVGSGVHYYDYSLDASGRANDYADSDSSVVENSFESDIIAACDLRQLDVGSDRVRIPACTLLHPSQTHAYTPHISRTAA